MNTTNGWRELGDAWRVAFELAWEAYTVPTVPVGAVVVDGDGRLVSTGRNRIFEREAPSGELANTWLAHAEVNALATLPPERYPHHALYTTLEPCFLCLGATLLSTVETVHFAAFDPIGAAAGHADTIRLRSRKVHLEGPRGDALDRFSALLVAEFFSRCLPESLTAARYAECAPELLELAAVARGRGLPDASSPAGGLELVADLLA